MKILRILLLGLTVPPLFSGCGTYDMAKETRGIWEYVNHHHKFKVKSKTDPSQPAFYWSSGAKYLFCFGPNSLLVYSIFDKAEQDKIISLVTNYVRDNRCCPVEVTFFEKENMTFYGPDSKGFSGSSRGEEIVLRRELIRN